MMTPGRDAEWWSPPAEKLNTTSRSPWHQAVSIPNATQFQSLMSRIHSVQSLARWWRAPPGEPTVLLVNNLGHRCIPGDTTLEAPGVAPNKTPSVLDKSVKHLTFLFSLSCISAGNKPDDHRGLLIRCWEKHHLSLTKYLLASSPW